MIELRQPSLLYETRRWAAEVPKILGAGPGGRPIHLSTVIRWITKGVRGRKLEAVKVGGRWLTSLEALERFCAISDLSTSSAPLRSQEPRFGLDGALQRKTRVQPGVTRRVRGDREQVVEEELDRIGI